MEETKRWLKVLEPNGLDEGGVTQVTCAHHTLCITRHQGAFAAFDNRCPHQGGPLGEGSIEQGWLRCPWHGWDFDPLTGRSPEGVDDALVRFPTEIRDDGLYVQLASEEEHRRTLSDVVAETLVNWGVRWVWGMVGHSNLGLADAIRTQEAKGRMGYVGIRHEGAAAFAASAYGKLTGRPAACLAIAGPGATNLLTGLWDAHVDGAPVVALTGQVPTQLIGRGAFQEVDLQQAYGGVATYSATAFPHSDVAELATLACKHAIVDRGVSHLVFPDDVQNLERADAPPGTPDGRVGPSAISAPRSSLEQALGLLRQAKRPIFIVGHGARFHMNDVLPLAEAVSAPILTTFKAKGLIPDSHPLGCGVLGRSGTPVASWFMNESDLLVVLGASFSNHTGIASYKPTIQVDFDRARLGRFHAVSAAVWGEIGTTAKALLEQLGTTSAIDQRPEIAARWALWRDEKRRRSAHHGEHGIAPAAVFRALSQVAPADAIVAVDVGNNTYSFGRYFECQGQSILMSGYLGSIGFGFPAALGAYAATQETDSLHAGRKVIAVTGDGGFGQYMAEYTSAVKYGMDITHILLNNSELAKISKEQRSGDWEVWQTTLHNPNFAQYAELCGGLGIRVTDPAKLEQAITEALNHPGLGVVEIISDPALV